MKRLLILSLFGFLFGCNNSESKAINSVQDTEEKSAGKLYLRTYMWTGMYGTSLDISWIWLGDDGRIVRNPKFGVNPVDIAGEEKENAKNTGSYKREGDKLKITWLDGRTAEWRVEEKGGEVSAIDGGIVSSPDAMPANYRISGKYSAMNVLPNVSSVQTLVFDEAGNFLLDQSGGISTPDVAANASSEKAGKYDITGNTLTLKFNNGEEKKAVIAIWDMDGERSLVINSSHYPEE